MLAFIHCLLKCPAPRAFALWGFLLPHKRGQKRKRVLLFYIVTPTYIASHVYEATPLGVKLPHSFHAHFHFKRHFSGRALHFIKLGWEGDVGFLSHCCLIFLYSIRYQTLVLAGRLLDALSPEFPFAHQAGFADARSEQAQLNWR